VSRFIVPLIFMAAGIIIVSRSCSPPTHAANPSEDAGKSIVGQTNLVKNPLFKLAEDNGKNPANFLIEGDATWTTTGRRDEFSDRGIVFHSGKDLDGDGKRAGSVSQVVSGLDAARNRWYRFSFRGLPESNFAVGGDDLYMKADFFSHQGADSLDGITRKLYALIERDRSELAINGNDRRGGAAVWKTYALEFKLPFPDIDQLRLSVGFRNGKASTARDADFYATDFALVAIPEPAPAPRAIAGRTTVAPSGDNLISLGGRWFYQAGADSASLAKALTVTTATAGRLFYREERLTNPFAENMSAWLRQGFMDISGKVVREDRLLENNVVVEFKDGKTLVVHARNIPNHPTGQFPERRGNPSYIQEHDYTYYLPLEPVPNPRAVAMTATNSNRALPMGVTGFAINGVAFYNPFDADMEDATDFMDRCCGHPSPDNRYHYHKYPVCVKSPFVDEGEEHSPVIGWALDGFPIYGPYESKGLMAKDDKANPLNAFNVHFDQVRGWHYHVTPGKFPYIIGGYWGVVDARNYRNNGRGGRPAGPGGRRGPPRD
jgi:hypothetical protein